jgi:deoxyribose-phosphate aldolase
MPKFEPTWLLQAPTSFKSAPRAYTSTRERIRQAIGLLDLTTLNADDTPAIVKALCAKGKQAQVAVVCVFPVFVETALEAVKGSNVKVATVAGAFPHGLSTLASRVKEVEECVKLGANEIDIVIRRPLALEDRWSELYDELAAMRRACVDLPFKVILATGELGTPERIWKAAMTAMMAGADFVKTSTGKEKINATLEAGMAMADAIRFYGEKAGRQVGLKAAGGIKTTEQSMGWLSLVENELGTDHLNPKGFRIGASGLLDDLLNAENGI